MKGWYGEKQKHSLASKGIKTKSNSACGLGDVGEKQRIIRKFWGYMSDNNIERLPAERETWNREFKFDGETAYYFWDKNDYVDEFVKVGSPFTEEEYRVIHKFYEDLGNLEEEF